MLRTELEKDYVRDDCLTIECNLAVPMEAHLSDIGVSYEIDVPSCDIPEHFAELLDEKVGADVAFDVQARSSRHTRPFLQRDRRCSRHNFSGICRVRRRWVM